MSLPNTEEREPQTKDEEPGTEDREQTNRPIRLFSFVLRPLRFVLHPPRTFLWAEAAACLCLVGIMILLRGCERPPATRPTSQMGIESRFWIRVLLLNDVTECTLEVPSAGRVAAAASDPNALAAELVMKPLATPTKISLVDGRLMLGTTPLAGQEVIFSPETPHIFGLNGLRWRGRLKLIVNSEGRSFDAVNIVPLEPYLAGVIGKEMYSTWQPQALQAQAIAARTYALFTKSRFGSRRSYDVRRTQASQVYEGIDAESPSAWEAVNRTCGQILITPDLLSQRARPAPEIPGLFPTYYSSTCGGHTIGSEAAFGGDSYGPLRGVPCPYCREVAPLKQFFWPMPTFDRATVTQQLVQRYPKLEALGEITDLTIVGESQHGPFSRLTKVRLTGATGKTDTLRAEDLRLTLDPSGRQIKSTLCRIIPWEDGWAFASGQGWGHGVGMCQYGAQGMALAGSTVETILRHYYPGAEIANIY
jgi:stage II sporulation protein D